MSRQTRQVLISGASSDIGIELCKQYLRRDYAVVAHYHTGRAEFFDLLNDNPNATPLQIDLSKPEDLESALESNRELLERSDAFVSAAAIAEPVSFEEIDANAILRHLHVNLLPGVLLTAMLAPKMMERAWGRIVHVSSIGVKFRGGARNFCYALSKHAAEFIPANYKSWASRNVFVNAVRVGVTDTRFHGNDPGKDMSERVSMIPAGRMATPEEMAGMLFSICSEENTFMTGEVVSIAGGE